VFWSLALAMTALAIGGEAPEARAADCNHTDVVFYNATDTGGRLAGELKKFTSLADRVEALGGRLTVDSVPGAGTRLRAEIPISGE